MHNNNNGHRKHKRFSKNNNFKKRRFGGTGGSANFEEQFISPQARRNFSNKRDQYLMKAKECLAAGERIEAENYFQHADHYHRMSVLGLDKIQQQNQNQEFDNNAEGENERDNFANESNMEEEAEIPVDSVGSFPNINSAKSQNDEVDNNLSALPFLQTPIREAE